MSRISVDKKMDFSWTTTRVLRSFDSDLRNSASAKKAGEEKEGLRVSNDLLLNVILLALVSLKVKLHRDSKKI